MSDPAPRTYFWDFFGPRSGPTAAHFEKHLREFLQQHGVGELQVALQAHSPAHSAVGVTTPPAHFELIEKALRPKRSAP